MLKRYILLFFAIILFNSATTGQAQVIDRSLFEQLEKERRVSERKEIEPKRILPEVIEPEPLSIIEKMFAERYFVTRERNKLKALRDSIIKEDTTAMKTKLELYQIEEQLDSITITLKQFGYNMFQIIPSVMAPFIPIAEEYILGPGDEVIVEISGQVNNSWTEKIDRDGKIVIPKVGSIKLWGKTYKEAKRTIEQTLNKEFSNIMVSVSLGELRSVNVYVVGEVNSPGLYNTSPLSDPLSLLFIAGGPKKSGSLRRIKYIPTTGKTRSLDLYNLLVKGKKLSHIQLESGDIIYVPPIGEVVGVTGAVNRPSIYEISGSEDLSDLFLFSGGMLPTGGNYRVQLERISSGKKKTVVDFRFRDEKEFKRKIRSIKIMNGDLLCVFEIPPLRHNYVIIDGNIERSGTYGWEEGMTVLDLIERAGGIKRGTYLKRAEIMRFWGVENPKIIEFDLKGLMEGNSTENIKLKEWDRLKIYSLDDIQERFTVTISGEIKNPGNYPLCPDMTIGDLIFKGILRRSASEKAEFFRVDPDRGVSLKVIELNDSIDFAILLAPQDHILIRKKPGYREVGYIKLLGEIGYPGTYPIQEGELLKDVVKRAGDFTKEAYLQGAMFTRKSVANLQNKAVQDLINATRMSILAEQRKLMEGELSKEERTAQMDYFRTQLRQVEELSKVPTPGRIVIDLSNPEQLNIPLEDGDALFIPKTPMTVQVIGKVYNPTGITYRKGLSLKKYLEMAGGPKPEADKRKIYVRRASGRVVKDPDEIKPGDTIIVPEKVEIGKSFWEVIGTVAIIVYQIGIGVAAAAAIMK